MDHSGLRSLLLPWELSRYFPSACEGLPTHIHCSLTPFSLCSNVVLVGAFPDQLGHLPLLPLHSLVRLFVYLLIIYLPHLNGPL